MSSIYGNKLKLSIFGQSHAPAIGMVLDGFPAGYKIDFDAMHGFMERRAPGRNAQSTSRREADEPEFLSGVNDGYTCGAPIASVIRNTNTRSGDYNGLSVTPRPSHADYTAKIRYGEHNDFSGGGHFSGRLTAPLCLAGALAKGLLEKNGITVNAMLCEIGGVSSSEEDMVRAIDEARARGDSVGGIVRCVAEGVPAGIGDPMFDGIENRIARIVFGIPAVRGIEFGAGFDAARMTGSTHNDPFTVENGKVKTKTNNHGGIIGGITTGMPVDFRVAFKPTPSIAVEQDTVDLEKMENTKLAIRGRHDPCIVLRALPCVEAACAIALLDALLESDCKLITE